MTRKTTAFTCIIVALCFALIITAGCTETRSPAGTGGPEPEAAGRLVVAVTIPPQEEMVRAVGGDRVDVIVLVPPGSDPHTFEPTPRQLEQASRADLYITVGSGLLPVEDTLGSRLRALHPGLAVVDGSAGTDRIVGSGGADPHVWLSLRNAERISENIRNALLGADPGSGTSYEENFTAYRDRIRALDHNLSGLFSGKEGSVVIVSHGAWDYFGRDYGLRMVSIEQGGREPTPRDLEELIGVAREAGVSVIFADVLENRRNAEVIAQAVGARVEEINPLASDYLANMERVATAFAGSIPS